MAPKLKKQYYSAVTLLNRKTANTYCEGLSKEILYTIIAQGAAYLSKFKVLKIWSCSSLLLNFYSINLGR